MVQTDAAAPAVSVAVECHSLADVDELLRELGQMDLTQRNVSDAIAKDTEASRLKHNAGLFVIVRGVQIPHADRRAAIQAVLKDWCEGHRTVILAAGDIKSRTLNFGTIGWEKDRDTVGPIEGGSVAGDGTVLDKAFAHLTRSILKFLGLPMALRRCLDVKVGWSLTALRKAFKAKTVTDKMLQATGFQYVVGKDQFYAVPRKIEAVSTSREGAA